MQLLNDEIFNKDLYIYWFYFRNSNILFSLVLVFFEDGSPLIFTQKG